LYISLWKLLNNYTTLHNFTRLENTALYPTLQPFTTLYNNLRQCTTFATIYNNLQRNSNKIQHVYTALQYFTIFSNNQTTNVTQLYNFTKPYKTLQNFVQLYTTLHNSTILRTTSQLFSQLEQTFTKLSITIHSFTISTKKLCTTPQNTSKYTHMYKTCQHFHNTLQIFQHVSILFKTFNTIYNSTQLYTTLQSFLLFKKDST
jgi:hypothetical protein